jgi:glycosyltransferase involved in cell wall biosynthesis
MPPEFERPRVAVVVSQLGYGGAEQQTIELLRALRGTGWAPKRVICLSEHVLPHGTTVRELGYPLTVLKRGGAFDLVRCLNLRRQLRRDGIGLVHAVNWLAAGYALVAAPRGVAVVSSIRNSRVPVGRARGLLLRSLLRRSRAVLVNSERGRRLVTDECRVPPDLVNVVPNGLNLNRVRRDFPGSFKHRFGIPLEAPLVAYVGRNAAVKNIPRLLAVVRRVVSAHATVEFVIVGEDLDSRIMAGTQLEGERRVHCLGVRNDVPALLSDASLLLLTSDSEGLPNVVLEALAVGTPVVAPAVGDLPTVVTRNWGVLVTPDVDDLASAVLRMLADLRSERTSVLADHVLGTYSLETMVAGTAAVWRSALLGPRASHVGFSVEKPWSHVEKPWSQQG